jgi:hypothetical protein
VITQAIRLLHRREHAALDGRHQWEHHQLAAKHAQELNNVQAQLEAEARNGGGGLQFGGGFPGGFEGQAFPQIPQQHPFNQIHPAFLQGKWVNAT